MPRPHLGDAREFRKGFDHVRKRDPRLAAVLERQGLIKFVPQGEMFEALVESILSQQLAGAAAESIIRKVRSLYPDGRLEATLVAETPSRKLRSAGVSPQKLSYLKDLSKKVNEGKVDLEALKTMEDEEIVSILDEVKGVGPWTVQMLLIFTLGRTDVLPVDDLGVKKAVQRVYSLAEMPKRAEIEKIGEIWRPYRSVASLYLWRHKDSG
ncbi:MAG: DNA-3-methyladenine glycosylase 2 family protein [Nitrososphaerota archaeon]|nr:DNA-3-methyladenine glycosylase 2 family protein [Nitrososphaerota archaeon]